MIRVIIDIVETPTVPGRCNMACEALDRLRTPAEVAVFERVTAVLRAEGERILRSYEEAGASGTMIEQKRPEDPI